MKSPKYLSPRVTVALAPELLLTVLSFSVLQADPQKGTSAAPEPESILEEDAMLIDDRPSKVVTRDVEVRGAPSSRLLKHRISCINALSISGNTPTCFMFKLKEI
jgi:hypothetical protein